MFPFHIVFGDRLPRALEVRKHELISQIRRGARQLLRLPECSQKDQYRNPPVL